MLEQIPQYQALSDDEKDAIIRRFAKIEANYHYPEREQRMRAELRKIVKELRQKPLPKEA